MARPLMPKATALWLIENTSLSFEQIAAFCELHPLEVQTIADDDAHISMVPFDPIVNQQLTEHEIDRCEKDPKARLVLLAPRDPLPQRKKGKKYTPVSKRSERPDAIAWLLKNYPELTDKHIMKLVGTTKNTIDAVRTRAHPNTAHIKPRCPVIMGLCKQTDLDEACDEAKVSKTPAESQA